jgi:hypothetical protein
MHLRLRTMMRPGGRILVLCRTRGVEQILERDFALISGGMPERDVAEIRFRGGFASYATQRVWASALARTASGRSWDLLRLGIVSALVAPFALFANRAALRSEPGRFPAFCTSVVLEVTVT